MRELPCYIKEAIETYRFSDRNAGVATLALAVAIGEYVRDLDLSLLSGNTTPSTRRLGLRLLAEYLGDNALASRLLAVHRLALRLADQELRLDMIRSQGVLFALIAVAKNVPDDGLPAVLRDAATMGIADFRERYRPPRRCSQTAQPAVGLVDLPAVLRWVEGADTHALGQVAAACLQRIGTIGTVVSSQHAEVS